MSTILCLAATHLSTLRPELPHYSRAALQLLGKSASLFREKLSSPVTVKNGEALVATSFLMQYISWSHVEFLEEQGRLSKHEGRSSLIVDLSQDPLFQLSSGVRGVFFEAFPVLWSSDSVFLSAWLYSARPAIEEAILQHGEDPHRFVDHFMEIWENRRYQSSTPEIQEERSLKSHKMKVNPVCAAIKILMRSAHDEFSLRESGPTGSLDFRTTKTEVMSKLPQNNSEPEPMTFKRIAKRLSLFFCLVSISTSNGQSSSQSLINLQPDIERCFFSFPVLFSAIFDDVALQNDPRALITLCHFYRAARILLTSPTSWWLARGVRSWNL